jgi:hypothetical protein
MKALRTIVPATLTFALAACAAPRDPSRYVSLGPHRSFYLIQAGSPLQEKLGYGLAPISDTADPLHRGYGSDVIAFYFNRSRVLAAPPAYITQQRPDPSYVGRLSHLVQGVSTEAEIERLFRAQNQRLRQPGGELLVYHRIDVYNALEQMTAPGGR